MMQRKVPSEVLIQDDNVESDKNLAHLQQSSQHQDGIITGGDDMNKSRSIQLSDIEASQSSSPSRRSFSKPRKASPSYVPITAKSPQNMEPLMRTDRSPHYMKPTRSSGANSQSGHDRKDQQPKFSNNFKASVVPGKKPAKTVTRPSSLKLSSTSTQDPSFKSSRESPRKSCKIDPHADTNPQRTPSLSSLKNSRSPRCSMPNPQVTESERTSLKKACRYTFCSLNGHRHTRLPPLKSFLSERRSLFKAQKAKKQEELSLQRLKVPFKTKVPDTEKIVNDGNSACDDAEEDFFIEIYSNEAKPTATGHGHETRKLESSEESQDQEVVKFMIESSLTAREDNINQMTTIISDESPELESNSKKDFKKSYDDTVTKADTMLSLHQEQNKETADENHLPSGSHEDTSMDVCCRGIRSNHREQLGSSEMDGCNFEATVTEWKEKQFCTSKLEERVVLAVLKEETEFKLESSSSESSLEASVKSDKILSTTRLEECACFEEAPHDTVLDLEVLQNLTNAEDNGGKNETSPENDIGCVANVLDVGQKHIFVKDGTPMSLSEQIYNASEEECKLNQVERATDKGSKNLGMKTTEMPQDFAKQVESNGYGRQGHEISELHKIDETSEGRGSSPEIGDGSISQVTQNLLKDVHIENIFTSQDKEMLEAVEDGANKFKGTSCKGTEEKKISKNWRGEMKHKMPVKDDEQPRKFIQRKTNFLPLSPNPEREKVNLKHQAMDERKSAEQWMFDHALRQAVTKLAPVRKSKVALLVEAFEEVMPVAQKEKPLKKGSTFAHARNVHA